MGLIYTRVSSDEQASERLSLPAQLQVCRSYAADKNWIIGGEHMDVLSGSRDDRASYQALLTEARLLAGQGRNVAVVVMRLDRFGRRVLERVRVREELKALGVSTHSVGEGGEVSDLVANILASVAQEQVARLGERVRDVRQHSQQNGWHVPGRAPWGYRWQPATEDERRAGAPKSVLVIDEATAPSVRELFRQVASGAMTTRGMARWIAGLPDDARGLVAASRGTRPRLLRITAVRLVLKGRVYLGQFEDGTSGRWEPLIDATTWNAVQSRVTVNPARGPVNGEHLLTGLLRCPDCGGRMAGWKKGPYRRYRCSAFNLGGVQRERECGATATAPVIDDAVLQQVAALLTNLVDGDTRVRRALAREWERRRTPDDTETRQRQRAMARAASDADNARRRIADATRLLVDGVISRAAYDLMAAEEQRRLEEAERVLHDVPTVSRVTALPSLSEVLLLFDGWTTVMKSTTISEQGAFLSLLIESVTPVRVRFGKYRADVAWTALGAALAAVSEHIHGAA